MDPSTPWGTQELSQMCAGALPMSWRTILSAPIIADFSLFSAIFQPLWCHTVAPEEPNLLVKVLLNFEE